MVNYQISRPTQTDLIFSSLADPTRREILVRLASRPHTVSEIAKPYKISMPAISKHLKVLEKAKLIKREKQGREHTIFLRPEKLKTVEEYISFYRKFWNTQFDLLEVFLTTDGGESKK